jgi:hypothetical protein
MQPTKFIFVKNKLPDGSVLSPVSIALVWTWQGPQPRQQTRQRKHITTYCTYGSFSNAAKCNYAFRTQEWFNLTTDDVVVRLRSTPPLVILLVGWLVGWLVGIAHLSAIGPLPHLSSPIPYWSARSTWLLYNQLPFRAKLTRVVFEKVGMIIASQRVIEVFGLLLGCAVVS